MTSAVLHLYADAQFASPYAMSVFVALVEKGLTFDMSTIDLGAGENKDEAYARLSRTARVPALRHGEFILSESSAITEYLDDVFPDKRLYPLDVERKARARQVQAWLRSDLMPIRQERNTEVVFYGAKRAALSSLAEGAAQKLFAVADDLLRDDAEYLFGEWTIADVDLALMLNRLTLHGDPVPEKLATYAQKQWQRPSVQQWRQQLRPPL
ncbi:MAG: glutathione S-transferase [Collimonas fungivorans]|uniref:glutathione transferase n=1 Tax=Collimonas fungivorans TaxID=158899 RepID=UPI0026EF543C|nr:glutathione transferase [Collimonas fungivorans]MDB5765930.1 glutathione S-transferase [Collimonas fungivorans]